MSKGYSPALSGLLAGLAAIGLTGQNALASLRGELGSFVPAIRHPNLDNWIGDAMTRYANTRQVPTTFGVEILPVCYYHRLDYAAAGTTNLLTFFNASESDFITNFPGGSGLQNNWGFMLDSIGVDIELGITAAGTYAATPLAYTTTDLASAGPVSDAEALRRIYKGGRLSLIVDSKQLVNAASLQNFSTGAGPEIQAAAITTATTKTGATSNVNNGSAFAANRGWTFARPIPILPGQKPDFKIAWQTAVPVSAASTVRAEMRGYLFRFA